jgi:hypothetical protein
LRGEQTVSFQKHNRLIQSRTLPWIKRLCKPWLLATQWVCDCRTVHRGDDERCRNGTKSCCRAFCARWFP